MSIRNKKGFPKNPGSDKQYKPMASRKVAVAIALRKWSYIGERKLKLLRQARAVNGGLIIEEFEMFYLFYFTYTKQQCQSNYLDDTALHFNLLFMVFNLYTV